MRGFTSDIRYALRTLRLGGISTVVAVLSLAVGVGANAAIFSVGHAMLARPLPYPGAERLVMLRSTIPSHDHFPQSLGHALRSRASASCALVKPRRAAFSYH
jgi:hypothetical protein